MSENLTIGNTIEMAMVDIAYDLLKNKGEPMLYQEIMNQVAKTKGYSEGEIEKYIAQLYTEINIDGRFTCVGRSLWGLKDWYPVEQTTESAVAANVKDDYLEEEIEDEFFTEEPISYNDNLDEIDELEIEVDDEEAAFVEEAELEDEIEDEEEED